MITDRELWQRARGLFDELVEIDPLLRRERLEAIGKEDPGLREAAEWLLAADTGADAALREYEFGMPRDSSAPTRGAADPLRLVGQTVSHFRVIEFLASGGMGAVYTAHDLSLGRVVALKFPLPNQPMDRAVHERFVNEARSAAALDHPNLCSVLEIGESEHGVFLAMPLYPGETLKERLSRDGALPAEEAIAMLIQVTTGLAAAHAAGIVHRDLKPGNVMLLPDGGVRILDFGLAKVRDVSLTRSHVTLGTIGYIAPEQIRNATVDARADLWALGVLLYETVTGTAPFRGEHELSVLHAVLHDVPPRPSAVKQDLPPALDTLIAGLLEKDPADRYASADALLADLAAVQRGTSLAFRAPFWKQSRTRRLRTAIVAVPAAALLVAGGITGWGLYRRGTSAELPASATSAGVSTLRWKDNATVVSSAAELAAALDPAHAGRRVRLRAGTYDLDGPLTVPDSMTLEGEGVMRFDASGRPDGFADGTGTTLRMTASTGGDLITLGNGVTVQNLEIVDLAGRSGNLIAVVSRRPGDGISTTISESILVNPNPLTISPAGAFGRALSVITRNLNMGAEPSPHEKSVLSVRLTRSIIRSPAGGGGFFAYNFAADSRISLDISRSVIGGSNEANGGVSRPDAVHDSEVRIVSHANVYRNEWTDRCVSALRGWNFTGGSGAPIPIALAETRRNTLRVRSTDDRIEGFTTAVLATGSRRFFASPLNPPPSGNHIDLQLIGTTILTPDCADVGRMSNTSGLPTTQFGQVADLSLTGAWVENSTLSPGDGNTLRAELRGVTGSGGRANRYLDAGGSTGELAAGRRGTDNRLQMVGTPDEFVRANRGIAPAPEARFFTPPRRE